MNQIIFDPQLLEDLSDSYLFVDTNTLIALLHNLDFREFVLKTLKEKDVVFITIPSVVFEFTRGSDDLDIFKSKLEFIKNFVAVYPIERHLDKIEDFTIVLQKLKGSIGYTDFLLYACLYKFPQSYLITENHQHLPLQIFDRKFVITIDTGTEIRNQAIYRFSIDKYNKAAENILKK